MAKGEQKGNREQKKPEEREDQGDRRGAKSKDGRLAAELRFWAKRNSDEAADLT